jgi:uncharacterized protein YjbJ (UPF0337 family)
MPAGTVTTSNTERKELEMDSSAKDKVEGTLKEAEGKLTGDDTRETQGKLEQKKGDLKDKLTSDDD